MNKDNEPCRCYFAQEPVVGKFPNNAFCKDLGTSLESPNGDQSPTGFNRHPFCRYKQATDPYCRLVDSEKFWKIYQELQQKSGRNILPR